MAASIPAYKPAAAAAAAEPATASDWALLVAVPFGVVELSLVDEAEEEEDEEEEEVEDAEEAPRLLLLWWWICWIGA